MALLVALTTVAISAAESFAHAFAPAVLTLREASDGSVAVRWKEPAARSRGTSLRPVLPTSCTGIGKPVVEREGTGLVASWTLSCAHGLVGSTLGVEGLGGNQGSALLHIELADGRTLQRLLTGDRPDFEISPLQSEFDVVWQYGRLGIEHILSGWDHLAFVLGLLLLVRGRQLLWTITSFTVGHSITLALAVLGMIWVPQAAIEALIALSIFVLALELLQTWSGRRPWLARHSWLMALSFGLLHGLGFAGALKEVGLPAHEIPTALFAFNVGIEIGQLLFVGFALAVAQLGRFVPPRFQPVLRWVPAYAIGSLGFYWFLDRLGAAAQALGLGVL